MCLGNLPYKQSQSALNHLFHISKYAMQPGFFENLKQFTKGIRQHVASKKAQEGNVSFIGKKKMGFDVYKKICELFLREKGEGFLFARAFLCLEWNLMERLENIVHAHILHVHWDANCLVFCFVKSKGNQTGPNSDKEWHVYANPHKPETCPVLALAGYKFANPGIFTDKTEEQEDAVEVEAQGGDGAGCLCSHKGCLFPGGNSMNNLSIVVCIGYLAWQLGIALSKERCKQPCLQQHNSLATNGIYMSLRYVEYGPREGAVPSV
jgi:hypothetical protein